MVRVDPVDRMRSASRRFAEPVESMAQTVARRATELVVEALDVNALLDRTDLNRLSTTIFSEGIDLIRSQAVGLDDFLARWVGRLLRRGSARPAAPLGPRLLVTPQAQR
jgi:hypothetical protein